MVPLLWLACLVPPALAQCSLVSVSGCQPDPHQVIQAVTAPSHQACQQLCRDEGQCRHWSYERATLTCSLLAHCSALLPPLLRSHHRGARTCLCQESGSCDDLVRENWQLLGRAANEKLASRRFKPGEGPSREEPSP